MAEARDGQKIEGDEGNSLRCWMAREQAEAARGFWRHESSSLARKESIGGCMKWRSSSNGVRERQLLEAQIDHGEASAVSRTVTGVHYSPHRGVQGRELSPAAPSPPFPAIPTARQLTGLGPVHFLRRSSQKVRPIPAQRPQSGPAALPGGSSFGQVV
ncbi:hypothetical protein CRG98_004808 [Punica granatum]|uniref:Uncharacterized protein n=1 Tax=Punica granatum TaxID=22663 RepID=A0A2I0L2G3_PUNGR|nr:hypothetical protein CRG98_004808 [Punica granatum]